MIITGILNFLYGAILLILTPITSLPDASISPQILSALGLINGYFGVIYSIIPGTTSAIVTSVGIVVATEVGVMLFKVVYFIIRKIPGIS